MPYTLPRACALAVAIALLGLGTVATAAAAHVQANVEAPFAQSQRQPVSGAGRLLRPLHARVQRISGAVCVYIIWLIFTPKRKGVTRIRL